MDPILVYTVAIKAFESDPSPDTLCKVSLNLFDMARSQSHDMEKYHEYLQKLEIKVVSKLRKPFINVLIECQRRAISDGQIVGQKKSLFRARRHSI